VTKKREDDAEDNDNGGMERLEKTSTYLEEI
jgi:hypothetical protein